MKKLFRLFLVLALVPLGAAQSLAQETLDCELDDNQVQRCQLLFDAVPTIVSTELRNSDGLPVNHIFERNGLTNEPSVLYLLFDNSDPSRRAILEATKDFALEVVDLANPALLIGVGTFSEEFTPVIDPTNDRNAVRRAIEGITAEGLSTELYKGILDALEVMVNADSGRQHRMVIAVFSDGKAEDVDYTRQDVVSRATELGVPIYGYGAVRRQGDAPSLQTLNRLAEETGGDAQSAAVGSGVFADGLADRLAGANQGGGTLSFEPRDLDEGRLELVLSFDDGSEQRRQLDVLETGFLNFGSLNDFLGERGTLEWWAKILILPIILLVIALFLLLRRRPEEVTFDPTDIPEPDLPEQMQDPMPMNDPIPVADPIPAPPPPEPQKIYGVLSDMTSGTQFPVTSTIMTIGRSGDADITIDNDSISRRHATISVTPDGQFQITDLQSLNGVVLNGEKTSSSNFGPGDVIQLGEVKLTFAYPT